MTEQALSGYTELKTLGSGGFGRVVLARHVATGSMVAVKYLRAELRGDPEFAAMFRSEAEVLGSLSDPCVVRLYEYVEWPDGAAIVMELVDGTTLREMLRRYGKTSPEAAIVVLYGSLLGLAAAHARGVVHRDYKPENVLINECGASKLTDFGIAARAGSQPVSAGSLAYAPPEQFDGTPASPASDVYAATVTFYECLAGRPPFTGESQETLMDQHRSAPIPFEAVPEALRPVIALGMAKSPAYRPSDAAALAASLRDAATSAYGPDWEHRGHWQLGEAALLLAALWPSGGAPSVGGFTVEQLQLARGHRQGLGGDRIAQPGGRPHGDESQSPAGRRRSHLLHVLHLEHLAHLLYLRRHGAGAVRTAAPGTRAYGDVQRPAMARATSRAGGRLRTIGALATVAAVAAAVATVAVTRQQAGTSSDASHPALSVYPVALATIPLTAAASIPKADGDVYVLYKGGADATAQLSGDIASAPGGGVVRLYEQQFPFSSAPVLAGTDTLGSAGGSASYTFQVSPTLATRYQVRLFGGASAAVPEAESAIETVYAVASFNQPPANCDGSGTCQETFTIYQPSSTLPTEMAKQWSVYVAPSNGSGPATQTLTLDPGAVVASARQVAADEYTRTVTYSSTAGNGTSQYTEICFKDTEAQDGTGLPNAAGCGDPTVQYKAYVG